MPMNYKQYQEGVSEDIAISCRRLAASPSYSSGQDLPSDMRKVPTGKNSFVRWQRNTHALIKIFPIINKRITATQKESDRSFPIYIVRRHGQADGTNFQTTTLAKPLAVTYLSSTPSQGFLKTFATFRYC